jgi:hypothetical protein
MYIKHQLVEKNNEKVAQQNNSTFQQHRFASI